MDVQERGRLADAERQVALALEAGPIADGVAYGAQALLALALAGIEGWIDVDQVDGGVVQLAEDVQVVGQDDSTSRLAYCTVNVSRSTTGGLVDT